MVNAMTPQLFACCFITALLNMLFGFDISSFAGVQNIPAFQRQFGEPIGEGGKYALSASRASFMSSIGFVGKFIGTLSAPVFIENLGHQLTMRILCLLGIIGVMVECSALAVGQFVLGRVIVYISVGLAENTATTYQSEITPASIRGAVVSSIQTFIQFGQIMSSGVNESFSTATTPSGWIIPVSIQALVPVVVLILSTFIPPSPRWLISKGRKEDAVFVLERVRTKGEVDGGHCRQEADAMEGAVHRSAKKEPWHHLFHGVNCRRTKIACSVFILQQFTGQAFVSQYSPRFYESVGLGAQAFQYTVGSATTGLAGTLVGMVLIDTIGRRPILIWGGIMQAPWLFAVAYLGSKANPSPEDSKALVASVLLFNFFFSGTWAPVAYIIASEIGTGSLREKTMAFASTVNVVAAWLVAFTVPYLLDAIGARTCYIYSFFAIGATVYAYCFVPEIKNRSLEELDELFETHVPARKFAETETHGAALRVAELENAQYEISGEDEYLDQTFSAGKPVVEQQELHEWNQEGSTSEANIEAIR